MSLLRRPVVRIVLILLFFALPAVLSIFFHDHAGEQAEALIGQTLPPFTATRLDGSTFDSRSYAGQPLILNFWATWCAPCRTEMPLLQALAEDTGVVVIGINGGEPVERVNAYINEIGINFPILLDADARLRSGFGISAYPTTMFVNAAGVIERVTLGALTPENLP